MPRLVKVRLTGLTCALIIGCSAGESGEEPLDADASTGGDLADAPGETDAAGETDATANTDVPGDSDAADQDAAETPRFEAANLLPDGDPLAAGQDIFLHGTFGGEVRGRWPPASFLLALMREEPDVFGDQFERFGFIPDPGDELPIGLKRGVRDPEQVNETCALCHVARLPDGRLWIGAPNSLLDIEGFNVAVNERWVAAGNPTLMDELSIQKARALGPGRTNAETDEYPDPVPADFPPYWNLDARTAMNYLGTGRNLWTEMHFAIRAFGPGNPNDDESDVGPFPSDEEIQPLHDFMASLRPPPPPPQDATLVARGEEVFDEARCASCHRLDDAAANGVTTYADDGVERYPGDDDTYPRGAIATSAQHLLLQTGGAGVSDEGYADIIDFILGHGLAVRQTDGYRVAPLAGLWATAPYLHNGSVPTLEDLLKPASERPETFLRGEFEMDTRVLGNGNEGHEFGADLTEDDKVALVAFLRSL